MLLAIDVGNTQTVVGLFAQASDDQPGSRGSGVPGLIESWRVTTVAERTAEEHIMQLSQLLALSAVGPVSPGGARLGSGQGAPAEERPHPEAGRTRMGNPAPGILAGVSGVAISSSVPRVSGALREMVERFLGVPVVVVGPGIKTGMPVLYENPREVGADRVANAVAALDLCAPPLVVVDLGTATTFDVVSAKGEYLGGAISPGLDISMDALYGHAAALPKVALREPQRVIGRTTVESMQSGAVYGHAALVDGMCARLVQELGALTVIATGGLASLVVPHASKVDRQEPWLTLHGLRLLYAMNAPPLLSAPVGPAASKTGPADGQARVPAGEVAR